MRSTFQFCAQHLKRGWWYSPKRKQQPSSCARWKKRKSLLLSVLIWLLWSRQMAPEKTNYEPLLALAKTNRNLRSSVPKIARQSSLTFAGWSSCSWGGEAKKTLMDSRFNFSRKLILEIVYNGIVLLVLVPRDENKPAAAVNSSGMCRGKLSSLIDRQLECWICPGEWDDCGIVVLPRSGN